MIKNKEYKDLCTLLKAYTKIAIAESKHRKTFTTLADKERQVQEAEIHLANIISTIAMRKRENQYH